MAKQNKEAQPKNIKLSVGMEKNKNTTSGTRPKDPGQKRMIAPPMAKKMMGKMKKVKAKI